jgi:hypothetical protein
MKRLQLLGAVCALLFILAGKAQAALVTYQFNGTCFSGSDGDCTFYGLSEGDSISGSITLDNQFLSYSQFTDILPTDPDFDFSFTFGNLSFSKTNLAPDAIRVKYLDPGGLELELQNPAFACINAIFPCNVLQDGSELLSYWTTFVSITSYIPTNLQEYAYGNGSWNIVPIPTALLLFGSGLFGLIGIGIKRKVV